MPRLSRPRFLLADGSRDHDAIEAAFGRRMRHYELFQRHVPGVCSLSEWRLNVLAALETDIEAEERNHQSAHAAKERVH